MNSIHTIMPVGESNFDSKVLQSTKGVLTAFWAPWSKPCQQMEAVLLDVAARCNGGVEIVKINADDNPNLSLWFDVQHIPTLLYFQGGQLRGTLVGTVSARAILNLIGGSQRFLPSKAGDSPRKA